jgi:hypothetical protein
MEAPAKIREKIRLRETYPGSRLEKAQERTLWFRIVMVMRITRTREQAEPARDPVLSVQECL